MTSNKYPQNNMPGGAPRGRHAPRPAQPGYPQRTPRPAQPAQRMAPGAPGAYPQQGARPEQPGGQPAYGQTVRYQRPPAYAQQQRQGGHPVQQQGAYRYPPAAYGQQSAQRRQPAGYRQQPYASRTPGAQQRPGQPYGAPARAGQPYGAQGPFFEGGPSKASMPPKKKKMALWKKALLVFLSVVLGLGVALAGVALWYTSSLNSNIHGDDALMKTLDGLLDKVSYDRGTYTLVLASDSRLGTVFSDAEGYEDGTGRSDVIMLVRSDPATGTITLVSIPRDTPITLDGSKRKINEAFRIGGAEAAIKAVQDVTGVRISHYVQIDFEGLERFIDTLGGVVVNVPADIQGTDPLTGDAIYLHAGDNQRLNGAEVLTLARTRKIYGENQEAKRQFGVREVAAAVIKEIATKSPLEMPGLISELSTCIQSDVSVGDMSTLASNFAKSDTKIYSCTGPSKGDIDPETGMWLCYENPEGWKALMKAVEAGEDPSSVYVDDAIVVPEGA